MPTLDTYDNEELGQSIMIYGQPKSGKTSLAATLASEGYNIIWFDFEKGSQTLKTSVPQEFKKNINLFRCDDSRDNPTAIHTAIKVMSMKPKQVCVQHGTADCIKCLQKKDPSLFETVDFSKLTTKDVVVFDSLTQLSDSARNEATKELTDFAKLEFKHYDKEGILLSMLLGAIQNASHFHRVVISHELAVEQPDKSEKIVPVAGTKNFSKKVAKYFDHVIYTRVHNNKHQAASSTGFNMKFLTGSRSNLALETGNVTLGQLLKAKTVAGGTAADLEEDDKGETIVRTSALINSLAKHGG